MWIAYRWYVALAQCQASCGSDLSPVLHFALDELGQPVVTKCANGMRLERAYYSIIIILKIIMGYLAYYYPSLFATHFGPVLESEHMHIIHVPPTYGSLPKGDDLAFVSQQTAKSHAAMNTYRDFAQPKCRTVVFILVVVKKRVSSTNMYKISPQHHPVTKIFPPFVTTAPHQCSVNIQPNIT